MTSYQIFNQDVKLVIVDADTPELAAKSAFESEFKRLYEVLESHGPNWGRGANRINGDGAENLDDCAVVFQNGERIAVIKIREIAHRGD